MVTGVSNISVYNTDLIGNHLGLKNDVSGTHTITFVNNIVYNAYAGGMQIDTQVSNPTVTESNNVWHLDPASTHQAKAVAFTTGTRAWTTTAVTDLPAAKGTNSRVWVNSLSVISGQYIIPRFPKWTGYAYQAGGNGTTNSNVNNEPTWPATLGQTVVDNDITWTCVALSNMSVDPLFTSASTGDFSLTALSPCCGVNLGSAYQTTINGRDRNAWGRGWSIGAYPLAGPPASYDQCNIR